MATICITGGTGLIGNALAQYLSAKGHAIIILSRSPKNSNQSLISYRQWNPENGTIDEKAITETDFIIHLAGAGVADKRWTNRRKEEIRKSRVDGSALIVKALAELPNKVQAVVSSSAIGWYGPDNKNAFIETDPAYQDFLGSTCEEWEKSIEPVTQSGKRLVKLRTGIVLSNDGGAFVEFKKPLRFGLAAVLGSGKQIVSWIHINDLVRMYEYAIENSQLNGTYNAVAPAPVSNKDLTLALATKIRGRAFITIPVPAIALKIVLGEMSIEVLKSATVSADKIRQSGFQFLYPSLDAALNELTV
ncbi:MAG: TIGR01777 family oxidoreductase [Lacibacter sp.]|nr:TIGR01777 family oxidoreductase [Lacibacter sp.]